MSCEADEITSRDSGTAPTEGGYACAGWEQESADQPYPLAYYRAAGQWAMRSYRTMGPATAARIARRTDLTPVVVEHAARLYCGYACSDVSVADRLGLCFNDFRAMFELNGIAAADECLYRIGTGQITKDLLLGQIKSKLQIKRRHEAKRKREAIPPLAGFTATAHAIIRETGALIRELQHHRYWAG